MEIIFWNLNGLSSLKNQSRLLNYLDWDVAILIEVTKESYKELCNEMNYESSELSLNISNTPSDKKRGLGCAIFIRNKEEYICNSPNHTHTCSREEISKFCGTYTRNYNKCEFYK